MRFLLALAQFDRDGNGLIDDHEVQPVIKPRATSPEHEVAASLARRGPVGARSHAVLS
jgi:hypothetical protein